MKVRNKINHAVVHEVTSEATDGCGMHCYGFKGAAGFFAADNYEPVPDWEDVTRDCAFQQRATDESEYGYFFDGFKNIGSLGSGYRAIKVKAELERRRGGWSDVFIIEKKEPQ